MSAVPDCAVCKRKHTAEQGCLTGVLLVCGGRDYCLWTRVVTALDHMAGRMVIAVVRHGNARGADSLAHRWALMRKLPTDPMKPDYKRFGQYKAPKIRNTEMAEKLPVPVACVAFPGGNGTRDMVAKAEAAGIPVWRVDWPKTEPTVDSPTT